VRPQLSLCCARSSIVHDSRLCCAYNGSLILILTLTQTLLITLSLNLNLTLLLALTLIMTLHDRVIGQSHRSFNRAELLSFYIMQIIWMSAVVCTVHTPACDKLHHSQDIGVDTLDWLHCIGTGVSVILQELFAGSFQISEHDVRYLCHTVFLAYDMLIDNKCELPRPFQGWFVIHMLGIAIINLHIECQMWSC